MNLLETKINKIHNLLLFKISNIIESKNSIINNLDLNLINNKFDLIKYQIIFYFCCIYIGVKMLKDN